MPRNRTWDVERAKELMSLGTMSHEKIAEQVGVSMATLNKYIKTLSLNDRSALVSENEWDASPPVPPVPSEPDMGKPTVSEQTPMSVSALAEIFTTVADNYQGAAATVALEDGTLVVGCRAAVEYGPDGRPRKIILTLL